MGYAVLKTFSLIVITGLFIISMSGCIGPRETLERLDTLVIGEQKLVWRNRLRIIDEEFNLLDILSPVDQWPFFVKEDARYIWVYMEVVFSNPLKRDWNFLNQGRVNITFVSPLGERMSYSYVTGLRGSDRYKEMVFISDPAIGQWYAEVKAYGTGRYTIKVEAFQS